MQRFILNLSVYYILMTVHTSQQDPNRPSKSILSFVAWTASIFVYLCFTAWALLPSKTLHAIGVTYYPSRYYAVALPAYVLVAYLFSGVVYVGINLLNTLDPEDLGALRDRGATASSLVAPLAFIKTLPGSGKDTGGIPEIGDIDPVLVSTVLAR